MFIYKQLLGCKVYRTLLTIFLLFISFNSFAQLFTNYSTIRNTSVTYNSIASTGNTIPGWRNSGLRPQDDNRSNFINIGFDFWYLGSKNTQVSVSTNGFLDFSSSTDEGDPSTDDFGPNNSSFTSPSAIQGTRLALAILYDDLCVPSGINGLTNSIKYQTTGTSPNRVFTVEWIGLITLNDSTANLNFQIKLFETSGVIQFNYGSMTAGTAAFSYTCGLNASTMSGNPSNGELKSQQTANSNSFSNSQQNNLTTIPNSNSQIVFTPIVPANPVNPLTFSLTGCSSMTINWTDWASNEFGYVLYNSIDNINFTFVAQTAANINSYNCTNLSPGIIYYWKVYAVTEGALSTAAIGINTTSIGLTRYSNVANGSWSTASHWSPSGVPSICDNVIIKNGHTMTVNTNATCNDLIVGEGTTGVLAIGNNHTSRSLVIGGNVTVTAGGTLRVNTSSNTTHKMSVKGKIINNSNFDLATDAGSLCDIIFNSPISTSITGNGAITKFNKITLAIGTGNTDSLFVSATNFNAATNDFLSIITGKFHLNNSLTNTFNFTSNFDIHNFAAIVINNANATFNYNTNLSIQGTLKLINGFLNVGTASDNNLFLNSGNFIMLNGAVTIGGRFYTPIIAHNSLFQMDGGSLSVATIGSTNTTIAPFHIGGTGSSFIMNGGSIIIQRSGGTGTQNLGFNATGISSFTVTGGTLQIGNASTPTNQIMLINSSVNLGNLSVNSANAIATLFTNDLTILNNVTIASGTLNSNARNIFLGGNWINSGTWIPSTGTVTFTGSTNHTLVNTNANVENYNHLVTTGTATLSLLDDIYLTGNLIIGNSTSLDVTTSNKIINLNGHWINDGTFIENNGQVNFLGTTLQNMSGTSTTTFDKLNINNASGTTILNGTYRIKNTLFLNNGLFNVTDANSFTLLSDATSTARIAPVVSGSVIGSFKIERFISNRSAGYSDMASPVVNTTIQDWDDELLLIYGYNPPSIYPSAWKYSETLWDYIPVTSASTTLSPGTGVEVYLDSDGSYTTFNSTTVNSIGQPFIGSLNLSSSLTNVNDGWNFVGNPYASFISWDNLHSTSTNISNQIMMYDESISDFQTYSTGNGIEIAPHQGFWVRSLGSPTFIISENKKTTSTSSNYRNTASNFTLNVASLSNSLNFNSRTQFKFTNDEELEIGENDLPFIGLAHPLAQDLFSVIEQNKFRVKHLSTNDDNYQIPIHFDSKTNGLYTINAINIEKLYEEGINCAILFDKKMGTTIDLLQNEEYSFYGFENDATNRFLLSISKNGNCEIPETEINYVTFTQDLNGLHVTLNALSEEKATIKLMNLLGQEIGLPQTLKPGNTTTISYPEVAGIYHLIVELGDKSITKKFYAH